MADKNNSSCWCCFDNFSLLYQPLPDYYDAMEPVVKVVVKETPDEYNIQGIKVDKDQKGIIIRNGVKIFRK